MGRCQLSVKQALWEDIQIVTSISKGQKILTPVATLDTVPSIHVQLHVVIRVIPIFTVTMAVYTLQ
jgi:hypothetical protein